MQIKILIDKNKKVIGYCDYGDMDDTIEVDVTDDIVLDELMTDYYYIDGRLQRLTRDDLVLQGVEVDLNEGEIIQDGKIVKVGKPSKWHKWTRKEWTVNLDEVKEIKRNELKKIRRDKVNENIIVNNSEFQVREQDLENFSDVERAITYKVKNLTDKINWILADNSIKKFTYEELLQVLIARGNRKQLIFKKYGELNFVLTKADTVEEIESIKWEE